MAGVTILQLPQANGLTGAEQIEGVQAGTSVRIPLSSIAALGPGPPGPIGPPGPVSLPSASAAGQVPVSNSTIAGDVTFQTLPVSTIPGAIYNGITSDSAALAAAITNAAGAPAGFYIPGPMFLNANITIPSNIQLTFVGAGLIKPGANNTITINGPINAGAWRIFDISNSGALINGTPDVTCCYDEWFGAVANGVTDCTVAMNANRAFAHAAGDIEIHQLAGTYLITGTVYGIGSSGQSPNAPSCFGVGKKKTIWSYPGIAVGLKFVGGSGLPQACVYRDIEFAGDSASMGVMFSGIEGYKLERCELDVNLIGVQFHNELSGQFTENVKLVDCEWRSNCTTAISFKVGAGNGSFNGSGWYDRCLVNASATGPVIDVGPGADPYHTSLDAHVWMTGQTGTSITFTSTFTGLGTEVSGTLSANFTGITGAYSVKFSSGQVRQVTLTNNAVSAAWLNPLTAAATAAATINSALINSAATAPFASFKTDNLCIETTTANQITLAQGKSVFLSGPGIRVNGLTIATGANVTAGTALRCETIGIASDSSISFTGGKTNQQVQLTTGANTIASNMAGTCRFVGLTITASNYDYRYVLIVDRDATGGTGFVAQVANQRSFNTAGYGAPTFTADTAGRLIITNASFPASGVSVYVAEQQLSAGVQGSGHIQF